MVVTQLHKPVSFVTVGRATTWADGWAIDAILCSYPYDSGAVLGRAFHVPASQTGEPRSEHHVRQDLWGLVAARRRGGLPKRYEI
jgi:hypothetical protein